MVVPNRLGRQWMTVATDETGRNVSIDDLGRRLRFSPELAAKLYDLLTPARP